MDAFEGSPIFITFECPPGIVSLDSWTSVWITIVTSITPSSISLSKFSKWPYQAFTMTKPINNNKKMSLWYVFSLVYMYRLSCSLLVSSFFRQYQTWEIEHPMLLVYGLRDIQHVLLLIRWFFYVYKMCLEMTAKEGSFIILTLWLISFFGVSTLIDQGQLLRKREPQHRRTLI